MPVNNYVAVDYVASAYFQTGISIDWSQRIIFVPKSYLTPSGTVFILDTNQFRLDLKSIEDSSIGMVFSDTHSHSTTITISGVTYARTFEIINGYTVTFEDGKYRVSLVGSNNNIIDVTNLNQVSVIPNNSAGAIVVGASSMTVAEAQQLSDVHQLLGNDITKPVVRVKTGATTSTIAVAGKTFTVVESPTDTITLTRTA